MRAYYFGNMYLSSIQQGIQSAHVTAEIMLKYVTVTGSYEITDDPKRIMAWDWAKNHKTMILLNGGYSENIHNLIEFFDTRENPYPWADFYEGQDALDGALTCAGIDRSFAACSSDDTRAYPTTLIILIPQFVCDYLLEGNACARKKKHKITSGGRPS